MKTRTPIALFLSLLLLILSSCTAPAQEHTSPAETAVNTQTAASAPAPSGQTGPETHPPVTVISPLPASTADTPTTSPTAPVPTTSPTAPEPTPSPTTPEPTPSPKPEGDGIWSVHKGRKKMTAYFACASHGGAEASVLLLRDRTAVDSWQNDRRDTLIDLAQVTLDGEGIGKAELVLPQGEQPCYLFVFIQDVVFEREVS